MVPGGPTVQFSMPTADQVRAYFEGTSDGLRAFGPKLLDVAWDVADDFLGHYADLYREAFEIQSNNRARAARALYEVAEFIGELKVMAMREQERLDEEYRAQQRQKELGMVQPDFGIPPLFEPVEAPLRPPALEVSFSPQESPRIARSHTTVGTVSAVPETLRRCAHTSRGLAEWLEGKMREGEAQWNRLRESSPWAALGALPIAAGIYRLVEEYRAEAQWLELIAQLFENAGANGSLSEYQVTLAVVGMDSRYVHQLLSD